MLHEQLGDQDDDRQPHRVATRRRLEAGVVAQLGEAGGEPLAELMGLPAGTALAEPAPFAGADREPRGGAELAGER